MMRSVFINILFVISSGSDALFDASLEMISRICRIVICFSYDIDSGYLVDGILLRFVEDDLEKKAF